MASLPAGNYAVAVSAQTAQPGSEPLTVALVYRSALDHAEQMLSSVDVSLTTSGTPATGNLAQSLHAKPPSATCGDALLLRLSHVQGTQTLLQVEATLDTP